MIATSAFAGNRPAGPQRGGRDRDRGRLGHGSHPGGGRADALVVVGQHDGQVVDVHLAAAGEVALAQVTPLWL